MKTKIENLSVALKDVHKRYLELERIQAEDYYQKKITPFEFLMMLTQDKNFKWLQPFSALIAEMDSFADESDEMTSFDLERFKKQVSKLFDENRYKDHLLADPSFVVLHSSLKKELNVLLEKK